MIRRTRDSAADVTASTIADFGDQWTRFQDNSGYYGSPELFEDIVGSVISSNEVAHRRVADIGSGTGRIVEMLLAAGASHVVAIEPSHAVDVLIKRFADRTAVVDVHHARGEAIAGLGPFDLVFSIGVLHHVVDPSPIVAAAFDALRRGGRLVVWLYGVEGNRAYLAVARPLRRITQHLPDNILQLLVRLIDAPLVAYIAACRFLPLPMRGYMRDHLARLAADKRRLTMFDQLNPAYAKYYSQDEARELLECAGFVDVRTHHRHGYSWTVIGTKP
ncbi:MAG TPA: class I SAM-dependent methyltransferase [Vicinamibacterales bacterium]|nr:class I SAM-dependent methyltransferase [Vicinamibacterales bacterium]